MNRHNEIVLEKHTLPITQEEFDLRVAEQIKLLIKSGYQVLVREEEENIVVLEFNEDNFTRDLGNPRCRWLTDEEYETVKLDKTFK